MFYGFMPIFSLHIPDTLNITSLSFFGGKVIFSTAEGYVFLDTLRIFKIPAMALGTCVSDGEIWVSSVYKIFKIDTSGQILDVLKFPQIIHSIRCQGKDIYVSYNQSIAVLKEKFSPKEILSVEEEFQDFITYEDTLWILFDSYITVYVEDSLLKIYPTVLDGKTLRKYRKVFWILDGKGNLWFVGEKKRVLCFENVLQFDVRGDTLVVLRNERFGRFINVLKVLYR